MNKQPMIFLFSLLTLALILIVVYLVSTDPFKSAPSATKSEMAAQQDPHAANDVVHLFGQNCAKCHGIVGEGKGSYPSLQNIKLSKAEIGNIIRRGKGEMPPFTKLSDQQVEQLSGFVLKIR